MSPFKPCIATMSLGDPIRHSLAFKLQKAADAGFQGIELYWDDFIADCRKDHSGPITGPKLCTTARRLRALCDDLRLEVVSLQPFRNFDGLVDDKARAERLDDFKIWVECAVIFRAGVICVPASIEAEGHTDSLLAIVRDLKSLAGIAAPYGISIGYESLCFSAYQDRWLDAWRIVCGGAKNVGLDGIECNNADYTGNIGFVLDTFNIVGERLPYGCTAGRRTGPVPNGTSDTALASFQADNDLLARVVSKEKLLLVQVADPDLEYEPTCGHEARVDGRPDKECIKAWSRFHRRFPLEGGAQGGLQEGILRAITAEKPTGIGYRGWISIEVFSKGGEVAGEETVVELAGRAGRSWRRLCGVMGWE